MSVMSSEAAKWKANASFISSAKISASYCTYKYVIKKKESHKTSLVPPLFIEMSVPRMESELSGICALGVSINASF